MSIPVNILDILHDRKIHKQKKTERQYTQTDRERHKYTKTLADILHMDMDIERHKQTTKRDIHTDRLLPNDKLRSEGKLNLGRQNLTYILSRKNVFSNSTMFNTEKNNIRHPSLTEKFKYFVVFVQTI